MEKVYPFSIKSEFYVFINLCSLIPHVMHLTAHYDRESSRLAEKLTFCADRYNLCRTDIDELKKKKLIKLVEWDGLPESIPCQVMIHCEGFDRVRVIFFNHSFQLPLECYEEPLLNRDLINSCERSDGFWIEFNMPLQDEDLGLSLSYSL